MNRLLPYLVLYLLFLVQAALSPWSPDLLLLTVIALAVTNERDRSPGVTRLVSCGHGAFAGLLLDLLTPGAFGLNLFIYAVVGYGAALLVNITYHAAWVALPLVFFALLFRLLGGLLTPAGTPPVAPLLVTALLTILLAFPWQWVVRLLSGPPRVNTG